MSPVEDPVEDNVQDNLEERERKEPYPLMCMVGCDGSGRSQAVEERYNHMIHFRVYPWWGPTQWGAIASKLNDDSVILIANSIFDLPPIWRDRVNIWFLFEGHDVACIYPHCSFETILRPDFIRWEPIHPQE